MRITSLQREVARAASVRTPDDPNVRPGASRWVVLAGVFLFCLLLTSPFLVNKPPAPPPGALIGSEGLRAQVTFAVELPSLREEWEQRREREHTRVWRYNPAVGGEIASRLDEILTLALAYEDGEEPGEELLARFRSDFPELQAIPDNRAADALDVLRDRRMRDSLHEIVETAYGRHIVTEDLPLFLEHRDRGILSITNENLLPHEHDLGPEAERFLRFPMDRLTWPEKLLLPAYESHYDGRPPEFEETVATNLLRALIKPSLTRDRQATRRAFEGFEAGSFSHEFQEGSWILPPGQSVTLTEEQAHILRQHRRAVDIKHGYRLLGHAAYVLIVFLILGFYVSKFSLELHFNTYNTLLISLPVVLALTVQFFIILLSEGNFETVGYLFPAGAIGMLGVLLLEVRMALLLVTWGCLLMGLQVDLSFEYVVVGLFGGYTAVAALHTIRKRWDAFRAGIMVGLANMAVILVLSFVSDPSLGTVPYVKAFMGLIGGIGTFLVLAILPLIERFGILTDIQLLEMSGLHHKLLRDMEEQAPGTWQHTLNVAKLAEAAATEIGVNYLLVRAGCYFHDIGKVRKPEFFTENQNSAEEKQRHDSLKPVMSARVIMNHVKEGAEIGRAHALPARIIDFITQHHGTCIIQYFHAKALKSFEAGESKEAPREEDYRYPGPKPQTIEAAIVMLADSVEATATAKLSSRKVREDEIRKIVHDTILDKFNDGQFDECNLTLRDLTVIRGTFIRVLKSRFHTRIDYPRKATAGGQKGARKEKKEKAPQKPRDATPGEATPGETAAPPRPAESQAGTTGERKTDETPRHPSTGDRPWKLE